MACDIKNQMQSLENEFVRIQVAIKEQRARYEKAKANYLECETKRNREKFYDQLSFLGGCLYAESANIYRRYKTLEEENERQVAMLNDDLREINSMRFTESEVNDGQKKFVCERCKKSFDTKDRQSLYVAIGKYRKLFKVIQLMKLMFSRNNYQNVICKGCANEIKISVLCSAEQLHRIADKDYEKWLLEVKNGQKKV